MKSYKQRKNEWLAAVEKFSVCTKPTSKDYELLIMAGSQCFRQGCGISWEDFVEPLKLLDKP